MGGETLTLEAELIEMMEGRANFYRLLARVFRKEVDAEFLEALAGQTQLLAALRGISRKGQSLLKDFLRQISAVQMESVVNDLTVEYADLFLGTGRSQGRSALPYASVYLGRDKSLMEEPYVQIRRFYQRAGFQAAAGSSELEDHVASVLEFLGHLAAGTSCSIAGGDWATAREQLSSQAEFLDKHVLTWVPAFCRDTSRHASSGFYKAFALLTAAFAKADRAVVEEASLELGGDE